MTFSRHEREAKTKGAPAAGWTFELWQEGEQASFSLPGVQADGTSKACAWCGNPSQMEDECHECCLVCT